MAQQTDTSRDAIADELKAIHRQKAYWQRTQQARMQEQEAKGLPPTPAIPTMPSMARWKALHEQARALLDAMQSEMQGYFDNRSETWQEGEKGEAFQEILDRVDEAHTAVEYVSLE